MNFFFDLKKAKLKRILKHILIVKKSHRRFAMDKIRKNVFFFWASGNSIPKYWAGHWSEKNFETSFE